MYQKIFFSLIIIFLSINSIAQPGIGSTKSLIKLEFEDVYELKITHQDVLLNINSIEKFKYGTQTNWLNSHLIVSGVKSYQISIKTIEPYFFNSNLVSNVSVSNVKVSAKTNSKINSLFLNENSQTLIIENNGAMVNYIDVKYEIPSENTFAFTSNTINIFQTIIIYTLIPN